MTGKEARQKLDILITEIETKKSELDALLGGARQISEQLTNILNDSDAKLTNIVTNEQQSGQKLQTVEQDLASMKTKEEELKTVMDNITKLSDDAKKEKDQISELSEKTEELLNRNNEQSEKITDMLQKAAAGTLFEAFNIRKGEHEKNIKFWIRMIVAAVVALLGVTGWLVWVVHAKGVLSYEFLVKLSVSIPLVYWLVFSTKQYTRSKRLEEEYAFKSAISLSLEAYRDLLKKEAGEPTKSDVIPLITEAVGKIFSSPSQTLAQNPSVEDKDVVDSFGGLLDKIIKLIGR